MTTIKTVFISFLYTRGFSKPYFIIPHDGQAVKVFQATIARKTMTNDQRSIKMGVMAEWKEAKILETGSYPAELCSVEEITTGYGQSWRWFFKVTTVDAEEVDVTALTTTNFSPASKAGRWTLIMTEGQRPGENFDLTQLEGCEVQVHIEKVRKPDGQEFSNVKEVLQLIDNKNSFWAQKHKPETPKADDEVRF